LWIGHDGGLGGSDILGCHCTCSYAFLVNRAMSGTELEGIVDAPSTADPTDTTGLVLTVDENGNPVWAPPTVEITGGGVNPPPVDESTAYCNDSVTPMTR